MNACSLIGNGSKPRKLVVLLGAILGAFFGAFFGAACGREAISPEGEITSESAALQSSDWVNGWQQLINVNGATVDVPGAPTACETRYVQTGGGMSLFRRDSVNLIATSWMFRSPFTDWQTICCQTFTLRPACASLDGAHDPNPLNPTDPYSSQFAVLGRASGTNRYQAAIWMLGTPADDEHFGQPPGPGQMVRDWAEIGSEAYSSSPAATVHAGKLIVIGRRTTTGSLAARTHGLNLATTGDPFLSGSPWAGPVSLPSLPSGWAAAGDPAFIHAPAANGPATIVTRATKTTNPPANPRLYRCTTSNGTSFSGWSQVSTGSAVVSSDPSLELGRDRTNPRITLYFRATDNRIYQASSNVGTSTFEAFTAIPFADTFVSAPAAVGGSLGTDPAHMVFAKKSGSDALWFTSTNLTVQ